MKYYVCQHLFSGWVAAIISQSSSKDKARPILLLSKSSSINRYDACFQWKYPLVTSFLWVWVSSRVSISLHKPIVNKQTFTRPQVAFITSESVWVGFGGLYQIICQCLQKIMSACGHLSLLDQRISELFKVVTSLWIQNVHVKDFFQQAFNPWRQNHCKNPSNYKLWNL